MATITLHAALRRIHGFLDRTQQVTGALAGFRDLNVVSGLGLAAQLTRLTTELISKDIVELSKGWKLVSLPPEVVGLVETFCSSFKESSGEGWDHYKIAGQGVLFDHRDGYHLRFLVEHDPVSFLYQAREHLWQAYGNQVMLIPRVRGPWDVDFQLRAHTPSAGLCSERALQVWERIKPFLEGGVTRSLLMDGRPGTGKTTITQYLVDRSQELHAHPRVLRIPTGDFTYLSSSMLQGLIGLMQPTILIIDDFDRITGVESLLDFLESCRRWVKFLAVTTNHLENLPHAVTRPGRFDEIQIIEGLGESFVRGFLGDLWEHLTEEQQQLLLPWPVAFLEELRARAAMIPNVSLENEILDLKTRVEKKEIPWWKKLQDKKDEAAAPAVAKS